MDIHRIHTYQDWQALTHKWDSLLQECPTSTFFQTWQWLMSWAECCLDDNRSLFILACFDKERLVGVAPWYIQTRKSGPFRLRELRFLAYPDPGSDYLAVLAAKRKERQVAHAVYDYLFHGPGQKTWDQLCLTDIRSDDLFLLHFMARVDGDGKYADLSFSGFCPYLVLPQLRRSSMPSSPQGGVRRSSMTPGSRNGSRKCGLQSAAAGRQAGRQL